MKLRRLAALSLVTAWLSVSGSAHGAVSTFTAKAAFDAAIAGLSAIQTVDFDAVASGTTFASGTGTGGLTFSYSIAGPSIGGPRSPGLRSPGPRSPGLRPVGKRPDRATAVAGWDERSLLGSKRPAHDRA